MRVTWKVVLATQAALLAGACNQQSASSHAGEPLAAQAAAAEKSSSTPVFRAPVARVVFVDQEECCDCTRARTDKSWAALQAAMAKLGRPVPVERLHMDTQGEQVAPLVKMRATMVIPALYFLDAEGNLVEQLQGEVTEAQCRELLQPV